MLRASLFTAVGILAIGASVLAAPAKSREAWAAGQIERFDPASKTVVITQGTNKLTFVLAGNAHVMQGKTELQPSNLGAEVGHQVKVRYTTSGGTRTADRIELSDVAAARPAKSSARK
jgi:hypothetical protein